MLVLTRHTSGKTDKSKLTITTPSGDTIEVSLFDLKGEQVKVGVTSHKKYNVVRNELLEKDNRGIQKPLN